MELPILAARGIYSPPADICLSKALVSGTRPRQQDAQSGQPQFSRLGLPTKYRPGTREPGTGPSDEARDHDGIRVSVHDEDDRIESLELLGLASS